VLAALLLVVVLAGVSLLHGSGIVPDRAAVTSREAVLLTEQPLQILSGTDPARHDSWADVALQDGARHQPAAVAALAGAFAIGLVALLLALIQRTMHDTTLAAACLLWAAHTGLTGVSAGNLVAQRGALMVILTCFAGLLGWHVARLLHVRLRAATGTLAMLALMLSGLVVWVLDAVGAVDGMVAQGLVMLVTLALGLWLLAGVVDRARETLSSRRARLQAGLVALLLAAVLGCAAQELFRMARWIPADTELRGLVGSSLLTRWAAVLLLGLLAGVRIDQAWRNRVRETQRSRRGAEARLNPRKHANVSRDRLQREPGDGVVTPSDQPERGTELQRLLDASQRPLPEALRELRRRVEPLLCSKAVQLAWVIGPEVHALALTKVETLQVLRIAQEALVNVVRHADGARHAALELEVLSGETGRHLRLMVYDDGHPAGVPPTACAPDQIPSRIGHGWITLQRQATALGAQLMVGPQPDGWSVELVMPLRGR
jgi:hypothetical protein